MMPKNIDILIIGAGIAGLWLHHRFRKLGYTSVLIEKNEVGGGQSVASQGILHSGIKYTLAGKVNKLARQISAMPQRWMDAIETGAEVDLRSANILTRSQMLMIPDGFLGGVTNLMTRNMLDNVESISQAIWSNDIKNSGFKGNLIAMNETVLDIPTVVNALASPYQDTIFSLDALPYFKPRLTIYTAASGNQDFAKQNQHTLRTQHRPLMMGFLKPAPFAVYAHLVGPSEKPIATITTHTDANGDLIWYIGGKVAERPKDDSPRDLYIDIQKALKKYMPSVDVSCLSWAALPIDRVEGKPNIGGFLPDTPAMHEEGDHIYCWPTKLTFAPMLSDMVLERIEARGIKSEAQDFSLPELPGVDTALPPWDKVAWTKL